MKTLDSKMLIESSVCALYNGNAFAWKLQLCRKQLKALSEALVATKAFEQKLMERDVSFEDVSEALKVKHAYARAFEREFGVSWPL